MIRSFRSLDAPSLHARHSVVAWIERASRVHATRTASLTCDDRLYQRAFGRADAGDRALFTVVTAGRAYLTTGGPTYALSAGEGLFLPHKRALEVRTEGDAYESLVVEWDGARDPSARRFSVDRDEARAIVERLNEDEAATPDALARVLAFVREAGLAVPDDVFAAPADGARELRGCSPPLPTAPASYARKRSPTRSTPCSRRSTRSRWRRISKHASASPRAR
jgi:hypothetical protein